MPSTELTISSGAINVAGACFIRLIPEDGISTSDALTTINGGTDGQIIILNTDSSSEIYITDTGNIRTPIGGLANTLYFTNSGDNVTLIYNSNISKWMTLSYYTLNAIQ